MGEFVPIDLEAVEGAFAASTDATRDARCPFASPILFADVLRARSMVDRIRSDRPSEPVA